MYKYLIIFISCIVSSHCYAIFCPTNFQSVNYGDSMSTVQQKCGAPTSQSAYSKRKTTSEIWTYYVRMNRDSTATSKMKVTFQADRIINIHIDENKVYQPGQNNLPIPTAAGQDVSSTSACGGYISMGDTTQTVQFACGAPVDKKQNFAPEPGPTITEFYYNVSPPVTLIFEDGKLTDRK